MMRFVKTVLARMSDVSGCHVTGVAIRVAADVALMGASLRFHEGVRRLQCTEAMRLVASMI